MTDAVTSTIARIILYYRNYFNRPFSPPQANDVKCIGKSRGPIKIMRIEWHFSQSPISSFIFRFLSLSLRIHLRVDWTTPNHPSAIFNITHHRIHAFSIKIHSGVDECIKLWREKKHDYYYNLHQSSSIVLLRIRLISFLILIRIIGLCGQSSLFWKYDNNNEKIQRKKKRSEWNWIWWNRIEPTTSPVQKWMGII